MSAKRVVRVIFGLLLLALFAVYSYVCFIAAPKSLQYDPSQAAQSPAPAESPDVSGPAAVESPAPAPITMQSAACISFFRRSVSAEKSFVYFIVIISEHVENNFNSVSFQKIPNSFHGNLGGFLLWKTENTR